MSDYRLFSDDDRRRELEARLLAAEREHYVAEVTADLALAAGDHASAAAALQKRDAHVTLIEKLAELVDALPPPSPAYRSPALRVADRPERPERMRPSRSSAETLLAAHRRVQAPAE